MASSKSSEEEALKVGGMFAVHPNKDCPHVESLVAGIEKLSIDIALPCGVCGNVGENWLCLKCSSVYCSRYIQEHMMHHNNQNPTHEITLSFSDLSFWCYACDSYIDSPHLESILKAATMANFDTPTQKLKNEASANSDPQELGASSSKEGEEGDEENPTAAQSVMPMENPEPEALPQSNPQTSGVPPDKEGEEEGGKTSNATNEVPSRAFHLESRLEKEVLLSRMRAVIYGNCIGDAIGLLTEFMTKEEALEIYCTVKERKFLGLMGFKWNMPVDKLELEYSMKCDDFHRSRWQVGDWTDDSDQMILILRTLLDKNGKADILDFVQKFKVWTKTGYKELGDHGGMGIGRTTFNVVLQKDFLTDPHKCAHQVWADSGRWVASNGGVTRTSILGIQDFGDIPTVIKNTRQICKVTHADPRCIASCVAVTTAIALMLQGKHCKGNGYDEEAICIEAFDYACAELQTRKEKEELRKHMFAKTLSDLRLSGDNKIGYTYKCLGAGFWAFRQKDFRVALTELVMEVCKSF
ncbi:uncharacterized protein LOC116297216 [Actinia tenebrosa]|uniref:Uncharacterized protein LOC116297216 n=1 Tax=Actinia tenebrosa TaxID=6105 RepID=A0A6P8I167_ACTTE|nr:uncharacterized protein LOC116297216 [Actinia tenebrosa]XP_031561271.1 uncharacterized protein LOC116297216 [Actinia tenebrosa]